MCYRCFIYYEGDIKIKTDVGGFDALKERFCAKECGCFPTSSEVFESLMKGEEDGNI